MRLNKKEVSAIVNAFAKIFPQSSYELFLFGSRVDDLKKGGDIDLLVIVSEKEKNNFVEAKTQIRSTIFQKLDEQKIDITVATQSELVKDAFLMSIAGSLVRLS